LFAFSFTVVLQYVVRCIMYIVHSTSAIISDELGTKPVCIYFYPNPPVYSLFISFDIRGDTPAIGTRFLIIEVAGDVINSFSGDAQRLSNGTTSVASMRFDFSDPHKIYLQYGDAPPPHLWYYLLLGIGIGAAIVGVVALINWRVNRGN